MSKISIFKSGMWLSLGYGISAIISFLRNVLIARLISVEDFGVASLFALAMSVVEMMSNIAIDRLLVQSPDGDDPKLQAVGQAFQVIRGLISGCLLYFTASYVAEFFKLTQSVFAFQILALVPIIRGFAHLDVARVQRTFNFTPTLMTDVIPQLFSLVIAILLGLWLHNYMVMVWTIIAQTLSFVLLTYYFAERRYTWAWDVAIIKRMVTFGWPLLANGVLMFIIFQGDKAVIGANFSMQTLGWYSAAFALTLAPSMLATKMVTALFLPMLSKVQNDKAVFFERYVLTMQWCLLIGSIISLMFILFGSFLMLALFGKAYQEAVFVVPWLGVMQAVRTIKAGPMISAMALGETKNAMLSNMIRGVSFLLVIFAVAEGYGILAIVVCGLVGELLAYGFSLWLLNYRLKLAISQFLTPILLLSVISALFLCLGIELALISNILIEVALAILAMLIGIALSVLCLPELKAQLIVLIKNSFALYLGKSNR